MSITTITPDELTQGIVLRKTIERLLKVTAERDALKDDAERYRELIYAVGNKYPDETRHAITAIQEHLHDHN